MESPLWFQQLHKAMREQRVPIAYANRLFDELWLHYLEMKESDEMNGFTDTDNQLSERLGHPETLAIHAARVGQTTWVSRHPWLTFLLGTQLVTFVFILACVCLSALTLLPFVKGSTTQTDPWLEPALYALGPLQVILPAILGCLLMLRLVRKSYCHPWWGVISSGLISILCMVTYITWTAPTNTPLSGKLSLGLGTPSLTSMAQALFPMIIGAIYAWRSLPPRQPLVENTTISTTRSAA